MSETDSWHGSKFSQYFHGLDRQRVYGSSARTIQLAVNSTYCTYPTIGTDINCLLCVATLREGMQKSRNIWLKDTNWHNQSSTFTHKWTKTNGRGSQIEQWRIHHQNNAGPLTFSLPLDKN